MTIQITKPAIEELINQRLRSGQFKDAEDVILNALQTSEVGSTDKSAGGGKSLSETMRSLSTFGKRHNLSLDRQTVKELIEESRP